MRRGRIDRRTGEAALDRVAQAVIALPDRAEVSLAELIGTRPDLIRSMHVRQMTSAQVAALLTEHGLAVAASTVRTIFADAGVPFRSGDGTEEASPSSSGRTRARPRLPTRPSRSDGAPARPAGVDRAAPPKNKRARGENKASAADAEPQRTAPRESLPNLFSGLGNGPGRTFASDVRQPIQEE